MVGVVDRASTGYAGTLLFSSFANGFGKHFGRLTGRSPWGIAPGAQTWQTLVERPNYAHTNFLGRI